LRQNDKNPAEKRRGFFIHFYNLIDPRRGRCAAAAVRELEKIL
jgi:hypothetical protein